MEPVREYLYVDVRRLNSYVEQIRSPITTDKVPVFKVGLSPIGPTVAATQERSSRPLTTHEKVEILLCHLKKTKGVAIGPAKYPKDFYTPAQHFRIESLTATKIYLPPKKELQSEFSGLKMWISCYDTGQKPNSLHNSDAEVSQRFLLLLEDFPYSDKDTCEFISSFSELLLLTSIYEPLIRKIEMGDELVTSTAYNKFVENPIGFLERFGAKRIDTRRISALYILRQGTENFPEPKVQRITTIGYPIVIVDDRTGLWELAR